MKKVLLTLLAVCFTTLVFSQMPNPVSWSYAAHKKGVGVYEIVITASIESPWHIYSKNTGKGGPIPTNISFKKNPMVTLTGDVKEVGKLEKVFDKNFNTDVLYYGHEVKFVQMVKLRGKVKTNLSGTIEYMVCDDSQCLPPVKKSFDLKLN